MVYPMRTSRMPMDYRSNLRVIRSILRGWLWVVIRGSIVIGRRIRVWPSGWRIIIFRGFMGLILGLWRWRLGRLVLFWGTLLWWVYINVDACLLLFSIDTHVICWQCILCSQSAIIFDNFQYKSSYIHVEPIRLCRIWYVLRSQQTSPRQRSLHKRS